MFKKFLGAVLISASLTSFACTIDGKEGFVPENDLNILIRQNIAGYFIDNTRTFNKPFYYSKLVGEIDSSDVSIVNSLTDIQLMKKDIDLLKAGHEILKQAE